VVKNVIIIGGGVIGLSIARELHKRGVRDITLVEQGICGTEASWAAAGMLGPQVEADELGSFFRLCSRSRDLYPHLSAALLDETGVDIELDRSGTLSVAFTESEMETLVGRFQKQSDAGLAVEMMSRSEILRVEPSISGDVVGGLYFTGDWQVENRRLLLALRRYAELNGVSICENTSVRALIFDGKSVVGVETDEGAIHADLTIAATGAWTSLIKFRRAELPIRVEPVRGQIVAYQPNEKVLRHIVYSPRGYVVPRADCRILAGSTAEFAGFDRSTTIDAAENLQRVAAEIVPALADQTIVDQWAGLRPFTIDGLPIIGEVGDTDDFLIATAHYRNGVLLAPVTAEIIAERVTIGKIDPAFADFRVDRFERSFAFSN